MIYEEGSGGSDRQQNIIKFVFFNAQIQCRRHLAENSAKTGARTRLELTVRCDFLLLVEGLTVTLG